jgi:putative (di)nucleoside polyphosphate hydrolase
MTPTVETEAAAIVSRGWSTAMVRSRTSSARDDSQSIPDGTGGALSERQAALPDDRDPDYRPGVGIMLFNADGDVFVARRADVQGEAWQMPQGGIDGGETPQHAAMRELKEEIGTNNAEIIAEAGRWLRYDVPPEFAWKAERRRWKGQRQKWFVMLFKGADADIDLGGEFNAWRWVSINELAALAVPFKRQLYLDVMGEFPTTLRD